jgi:hypothetical protein
MTYETYIVSCEQPQVLHVLHNLKDWDLDDLKETSVHVIS